MCSSRSRGRERYLDRLWRDAHVRVHAKLVELAVTTAITPGGDR